MADKETTEKILRTPVTAVCRKGHDWAAEMWALRTARLTGKAIQTPGY